MRVSLSDDDEMGLDVFMDVITNHTADIIQYEGGDASYASKADEPYLDVNGDPFDDSDFAWSGEGSPEFPEMDLTGFPRTPVLPSGKRSSCAAQVRPDRGFLDVDRGVHWDGRLDRPGNCAGRLRR